MQEFTHEPRLLVLSSEASVATDQALAKFAGFLGVSANLVPVRAGTAEPPPEIQAVPPAEACLAISWTALQSLRSQSWLSNLLEQARAILVYGAVNDGAEGEELKRLTRGAMTSVVAIQSKPCRCEVHANGAGAAFPVGGRSYTVDPAVTPRVFAGPSTVAGLDTIISVNGQPCFVSRPHGRATLFLLASPTLPDIDAPLVPTCLPRRWYLELLGMSIFLRSVFGPWCWTAPARSVTLVIDDPYLRERYGFLRYEPLARELEQTGCSLTVAFIPYNHWRSDRRVADLMLRQPGRFSITVHGCDHTNAEFASRDEEWLSQKARWAREWMDAHTLLTRMPYDKVMVFPQGEFSTAAVRALKQCGYLAVVNTTQWPVDPGERPLTLRDLLDVAVTKYDGFPIFGRRYPDNAFDFAFDTLFQKPLVIGEHHAFFKHGFEPLRRLVRELAALENAPVWRPLQETITSSIVVKRMGPGRYGARFFTPVTRLRNTTGERCLYSLKKAEVPDLIEQVTAGGRRVPFGWQAGFLTCEVWLDPGEECEVRLDYRQPENRTHEYRRSWSFRSRVFARRMLSDVRDNYLARNDRLLAAAERVKDKLFEDGII
ncbi:MAG TPA: hypothetical protein VMV72_02205 [Verrucomicrobiae bacterium]|nr:hypothetical protein [Verrucomicrobiae bacterium]